MKFDWYRLLPYYQFQNCPTDWTWDKILNELLDEHGVKGLDSHTAKVGHLEVWVSNYPYAYGSPYYPTKVDIIPSVKTRKRLKSMLGEIDYDYLRYGE